MSIIARAGEGLARGINRRTAIKRAASAVFGAVAALSVEGWKRNSALAGHCAYVTTGDCSCNPPYGTFCSQIDASYCSGATCAGGCSFDESWRYVGGCWCSATCEYTAEDGSPFSGYYKCCDCNCYGSQCSCREFVPGGVSEDEGTVFVPPPATDTGDDGGRPIDEGPGVVPSPGGGFDFPPGFPFDE
jgi:hypothetical protein